MAADQTINIDATLGASEGQLNKLKSLFADQAASIAKFVDSTISLDAASKKLQVTFTGLNDAFERVEATLKIGAKGGIEGGKRAISDLTAAADASTKKLDDLAAAVRGAGTKVNIVDKGSVDAGLAAISAFSAAFDEKLDKLIVTTRRVRQGLATELQGVAKSVQDLQASLAALPTAAAAPTRSPGSGTGFKNAKDDVARALATSSRFSGGSIPPSASTGEISAFQNAVNQLAKEAAGTRFTGGREGNLVSILRDAGTAAIDVSDKLAGVKAAALNVVRAYEELGESTKRAAEKADAAARRKTEASTREAERLRREAERAREESDRETARVQNARVASSFTPKLRADFVPSGLAPTDQLKFDIPIKSLDSAIRAGRVNVDALAKVLDDLKTSGKADFTELEVHTQRWIKSILQAGQSIRGTASSLPDLRTRVAEADAVFESLQKNARAVLGGRPPTDQIDKAIDRLTVLARAGETSKARIEEISTALARTGSIKGISGEVTSTDRAVAALIRRLDELTRTATKAFDAKDKAEGLKKAAADAVPAVERLVAALSKQFGEIGDPRKLLQLQIQLNRIFADIERGKFTVKDLEAAFGRLGRGGGTPPVLPPGGEASAQASLLRLSELFRQAGDEGTKSGKSILLTWDAVIRIFQVQVLHQVIGGIITDFRNALPEATKFQIKISEIRTISQDAQQSAGAFAAQLRQVSDSFGLPLLDVAKAAYDAISNQVVRGAQAVQFLNTTLQFSRVTVSSAADSVNLLSSVVKAYGEANVSTERAAAVLFKVIDLGRVTASEMGNTFGRVAVLASQTGVSIEELGAAIATITVRGTKYSEAYTLVNNVLLKLIKPTDEMKKLLATWGVETGEAAIQTFGFVGVLRLLQKELDSGGTSRLGELERDIRAIRGALSLVGGDALKDFEANVAQIRDSANSYAKAIEIINESPGLQIEKQFNAIKNFITVDLGQELAKEVLKLSQPFGGLAKIVTETITVILKMARVVGDLLDVVLSVTRSTTDFLSVLGRILPTVKQLTTLFLLYVTYTLSLRAATVAVAVATAIYNAVATASISSLRGAAGAAREKAAADVTAAASAGRAAVAANVLAVATSLLIASQLNAKDAARNLVGLLDQVEEKQRRVAEQTQQQAIEQQRTREVESFKRANEEKFQLLNQYVARLRVFVTKFAEDARRADKLGLDALRSNFKDLLQFVDEGTQTLAAFQDQVVKNVASSTKRVDEIRSKSEGRKASGNLFEVPEAERAVATARELDRILTDLSKQTGADFSKILGGVNVVGVNAQLQETQLRFNSISDAVRELERLESEAAQESVRGLNANFGKLGANIANQAAIRRELASIPLISPEVLDQARRTLDEMDKLLESQVEKVRAGIKSQERLLVELRAKSDNREFEASLVDKDVLVVTDLVIAKIRVLREQAHDLFDKASLDDARKKFEEIERVIDSQVKSLGSALRAQQKLLADRSNRDDAKFFEHQISRLDVVGATAPILARVEQLRATAEQLFDTGNLEDARRLFAEINGLVDQQHDKLVAAAKQQEKLVSDLLVKAEGRNFERSLIGLGNVEATTRTLQKVSELKVEARDLFDSGSLEGARKKFEEIDALLEKIFDRQRTFREKAAKLGVVFSTPLAGGAIDSAISKNDADRLARETALLQSLRGQLDPLTGARAKSDLSSQLLERGRERDLRAQLDTLRLIQKTADGERESREKSQLATLQKSLIDLEDQQAELTKKRIELEEVFQTQQKLRFQAALEAEKLLKEISEQSLAINKERLDTEEKLTRLAKERADAQKLQIDSLSALKAAARDTRKELDAIEKPAVTANPNNRKIQAFNRAQIAKEALGDFEKAVEGIEKTSDPVDRVRKVFAANQTLDDLRKELISVRAASLGHGSSLGELEKSAKPEERREFRDTLTVDPALQGDVLRIDTFIKGLRSQLNGVLSGQTNSRFADKEIEELKKKNEELLKKVDEITRGGQLNLDKVGATNPFNKLKGEADGFNTTLDGTEERLKRLINLLDRVGTLKQNLPLGGDRPGPGKANGGQFKTDDTLGLFNRDEFVVNAAASQRFAPQLRSINMGFDPGSGSRSGPSVNVGDVYVTVEGGRGGEATARDIGDALRREIRRGTLKL